MQPRIDPAPLAWDAGGTACSPQFGDIYHAAASGPGQAQQVFIAGNGLPERWARRERFVILENGFGSGLNFLATWSAWVADPARPRRLHYLAIEKHPFRREDLAALHAQWPQFAQLAAALQAQWPLLIGGFHRLEFSSSAHGADGDVVLTLMLGESADCLKNTRASVDAFYLDGFDPRKNTAMWDVGLFRRMRQLAAPEATLATWCVARSVRDNLQAAGFHTEKRAGFAGKRERLVGCAAGEVAALPTPLHTPEQRHAIVLGAGLAGCAISERLARRQWRIDLIDQHPQIASGASGNLAGIVRPLLSRDDNRASRLNRACFLHARRAWNALRAAGHSFPHQLDGLLQIAKNASHEALQAAVAESGDYPSEYVRFIDQPEASQRYGTPMRHGGWWFAQGGWASPPGACAAMLAEAGAQVSLHLDSAVSSTDWDAAKQLWRVRNIAGQVIAAAPVLILASGAQAKTLNLASGLPISAVRGQVSHLPDGTLPSLPHALCGDGYLTPAHQGVHCLGASYAYDQATELRAEEHADNLRRLSHLMPDAATFKTLENLKGRVGFRAATPDRLPLVGAMSAHEDDSFIQPGQRLAETPRIPGLHAILGMGSRGLVWASLTAEHLASTLDNDPSPLERDLSEAMDPARFALRAARRARS